MGPDGRSSTTYRAAGVDLEAKDRVVQRIAVQAARTPSRGVVAGVGGFAGLFALADAGGTWRDPVLVACTDGVGTKLKVAFACGRHRGVGVDLVAMSVNDLVTSGARPLFFLDYIATGRLLPLVCEEVEAGVADGCIEAGCALLGGETAEMPGFYGHGEYDLAGFCVGVVERGEVLDGRAARPGDRLVGIPSSGLHSNGYSLARRVLFETMGLGPASVLPELARPLGEVLLEPTRIYARLTAELLSAFRRHEEVRGLAHITGEGLPGNVPRALAPGLGLRLDRGAWTPPPIFEVIARGGGVAPDEMLRVFNLGIGMVAVVAEGATGRVVRWLADKGEDARVIGEVVA
ncbi:MAG: phosphoribosylformylglycinamidine cyclo-ligase [Planctomycetes bacterium]|nr:phosphoribosylformylglycinamidine cyclo-ligase [Planctomycetota bacterium]